MINIKLGNKLRELRKKRNLKQSEVAELTNLNVKTIQRYEKGENIPERFLNLFVEKLELPIVTVFELKELFFKNPYMDNEEAIKYHINELIKIVGYEFEELENLGMYEDNVIIKNIYTGDIYRKHIEFYDSYSSIILTILKGLIIQEINGLEPIKYDPSYLKTEDYKKITEKYYKLAEPVLIEQFELKKKIDKLADSELKEIEALKQKLNPNKK